MHSTHPNDKKLVLLCSHLDFGHYVRKCPSLFIAPGWQKGHLKVFYVFTSPTRGHVVGAFPFPALGRGVFSVRL